jgi:hypothetical protein
MGWLDDFLDALGMTKDGLDKELESQEVLEARVELAQEVAEYWRSVSPIGDPETDPHAGEYRDSIEVEVDGNDVKVVARDDKAHLMEFGSVHNPEFAPRAKTWAHFSKQAERSAVALELNIKALLDESSARGAVRDAERFFEKKAADLKVDAKLNEIAARTAVGDAKEFFLRQAAELKVKAKLNSVMRAPSSRRLSAISRRLAVTRAPALCGSFSPASLRSSARWAARRTTSSARYRQEQVPPRSVWPESVLPQ